MKLYCVYGLIAWEGEFCHTYFLNKCYADEFKKLWDADLGCMDSIRVVEVKAIGSRSDTPTAQSELKDILSEINKRGEK